MVNLVVNARDAMPEGGRSWFVRDRTGNSGPAKGYCHGYGTATGMTEEVRQRAAEPFFTTKPVGQGSGLGLSQV